MHGNATPSLLVRDSGESSDIRFVWRSHPVSHRKENDIGEGISGRRICGRPSGFGGWVTPRSVEGGLKFMASHGQESGSPQKR